MALKSTIFKAHLQLADIDHGYYADHSLTLARHPSETDERMMVRLAALALQAHKVQTLCRGDATWAFGAGLSDPDEPDGCLRDFTGRMRVWLEVGQPDDKALLKACAKADAVVLYCFGSAADIWWRGMHSKLARARTLSVIRFPSAQTQALAAMARRSMQLQATVQEGTLSMTQDAAHVELAPERWL